MYLGIKNIDSEDLIYDLIGLQARWNTRDFFLFPGEISDWSSL